MIEELNNVLQGKATVIKNNCYASAMSYIQPFIERLQPLQPTFRCLVKVPDQLTVSNGQTDIVYNKVHIQAILPTTYYNQHGYQKVVGMIYGIDCKIPIAKFYVGDYNPQNNNIIIIDQQALNVQTLESDTPINYSCIQGLLERQDRNTLVIGQLKQAIIDRQLLPGQLGHMINFVLDESYYNESGKIKLATSIPIDAYKVLIKDKDSAFYVPESQAITVYDLYQAALSSITNDDKDIINRVEKTFLINKMLHIS